MNLLKKIWNDIVYFLTNWSFRKVIIILFIFVFGLGSYAVGSYLIYGGSDGIMSHKANKKASHKVAKQNNDLKSFFGIPSAEQIYTDYAKENGGSYGNKETYDNLVRQYGKDKAQQIYQGFNWSPDLTPNQADYAKYNLEWWRQSNGIDDNEGYLLGNLATPTTNTYVAPQRNAADIEYNHIKINPYYGNNIYALQGDGDKSEGVIYWNTDDPNINASLLLSPNGSEVLILLQFNDDTRKSTANRQIKKFFDKYEMAIGNNKLKPEQYDLQSLYEDNKFGKEYDKAKWVMGKSVFVFDAQISGEKSNKNANWYINGKPQAQFVPVKEMKF